LTKPIEKKMNLFNQKPWVKICGLTDPENALACASLGADAIGLVFFEKSLRNVSIPQASAISRILPTSVQPIGVFVDASYETIMEKTARCSLKGVQLHGTESPFLVEQLVRENLWVIKALFARKPPFLHQAEAYAHASCVLVEYGQGKLPGGNAETWDYGITRQIPPNIPFVLAGGLCPETIGPAIMASNPDGVDVSSGVEKRPGIKDLAKVKAFMDGVRSRNRPVSLS
jgi:phosphoribosylanthranilate isomerase